MPLSKIDSDSLNTGVPTRAQLPAGCVLQVLQGYRSAEVVTTSTSFIDATGVTVSITPSSATNKVLVNVAGSFEAISTTVEGRGQAKIQKNGADLTGEVLFGWYFSPDMTSDGNTYGGLCFSFLDSPSSTSSLTYTLQIKAFSGVTVKVSRISITVMEIAA
jgi:hypothetical protein